MESISIQTSSPAKEQMKSKYYSVHAIGICSFVFGPLAGGYMMYKNFLLLGETESARRTLYTFVIGFILFGIYLISPYTIPFGSAGSIAITIAIYSFAERRQKLSLEEYKKSGGQQYRFGRNLATACGALLVTLLYIVAVVVIAGIIHP